MRAHSVDTNQAELVSILRSVGASVQDLSMVGGGCPDLLVGYHWKTYLLEVKDEDGKVMPNQSHWHNKWRGRPVSIVRSVDDALVAIGARHAVAKRLEENLK